MVFWTQSELNSYIRESLRWWGLTSMYFRETSRFNTVSGQAFYDLPTILTNLAGSSFVQSTTITDRDMINDSALMLMEPPITAWGAGWIGTEMFTLEDVTELLEKSRDDILKLSGILVGEVTETVVPNQSRIDLSDSLIQIIRADYQEVSSNRYILWATDSVQDQTTIRSTWQPDSGRSKAFSVNYTPQLSVDLWPPPQNDATVRLQCVSSGASFTPTATSTLFGLPEDSCWVAKYRALEDLLAGDGLSRAWKMAQYCSGRVSDGLDAMNSYLSMTWADVGGRRVPIQPLSELDIQRPSWMNGTSTPRQVYQLSWNRMAVYPVPDGIYRITIEAVRKAPVPTADGDYIQVGRESLQALLDYAQHIASFKMQGGEFESTIPLYQSAMREAMDYRSQILSQSLVGGRTTAWQSKQDRWTRPYRDAAQAEEISKEVPSGANI